MGLRIKAFILGVAIGLWSSLAGALGLGEITLNSSLNEPLNAQIELLQVRELTEREILVSLATREEFERLGIDRAFFLTDLKFEVKVNSSSGPYIQVTSQKQVVEPFLNFAVQVQWPSGNLLREYTLLVDLPVFAGAQAQPVAPAPRQSAPSRPVTSGTVQRTPTQRTSDTPTMSERMSNPGARAPVVNTRTHDGDEYGPVGANDNLWSIAASVRPDSGVSIQQTMLALQRLNPNAFINNNINLLRRGQVLRIPSKDDILQTGTREAIREVADQNSAWKNGETRAQLEGSRSYSSTRNTESGPEGRVKLTTSSSESGLAPGGDSDGEGLRNRLSATQEELDAANRENQDLRDRIRAMEEQIDTMEKLVEVSNAEMAELEQVAKQLNEQSEEPSEVPVETPEQSGTDSEAESPTDVAEANNQTPQQQPEVEQKAEPEKATPPPPPPAPKAKTDIMALVMDNIVYIGGGVAALLVLLIGFLFMRNRNDGFNEDEEDEFVLGESGFDEPEEEPYFEEDSDGDTQVQYPESEPEPFDEELSYEPEEDIAAEAETEDVVAECDIHLAYGQYDQAEEKLIGALEKDPGNVATRVKLLEVFAAQNDVDNFDDHYSKLHVLDDSEALDRAEVLRNTIEDAPLFDLSAHDTRQFAALLGGDYSSSDTQIQYDEESSSDDLSFESESDELSFDTGLDLDLEPETELESPDDSEAGSGFDEAMDFNLELDDSNSKDIDDHESDELDLDLDSLGGELESDAELADGLSEDDFADVEFDLDDTNLDIDLDDVNLDGDDISLDDDVDLNLEDSELSLSDGDLNLNDGELNLGEDDLSLGSEDFTTSDDSGDLDLDLELDDSESPAQEDDLSLDDLSLGDELSLDDDEDKTLIQDFDSDLELDEPESKEELLPEFTGSFLDENTTLTSEKDDESELDLDELDLDLESSDFSGLGGDDLSESALQEEEQEFAANLDEELDSVLIDSEQEDRGSIIDHISSDSESPEETLESEESSLVDDESLDSLGDFDENLELESDVNLDALDQELDALVEEGFDGPNSSSDMDEPQIDFGDDLESGLSDAEDDLGFSAQDFGSDAEILELDDDKEEIPELSGDDVLDELSASVDAELGDMAEAEDQLEEEPGFKPEVKSEETVVSAQGGAPQAVNDDDLDFEIPDFDPEEDDDSNLGFLSDSDETATKLDLARAYIDMGDADGAKDILDEILEEGNNDQKKEAETLLQRLG